MRVERMGVDDVERVVAASRLFDHQARVEWAERFLTRDGHHLLLASADGVDVGFVSGVEVTHPDKGTEMLLYELGVDEAHRGQGVGRALTQALGELARQLGCYGMWVVTEPDNAAAIATYRAAAADDLEATVTIAWTF